MNKKKLMIAVVCMVIIGCYVGGGAVYFIRTIQDQKQGSTEAIAKLEKEFKEASEKAEEASSNAEKAKKNASDAEKEAERYKRQLESFEKEETPEPTPIPTTTPEPVPTVVGTSIPQDKKCHMEIEGSYVEPGSGRVVIDIARDHEYIAANPDLDIFSVRISGSNGAMSHSEGYMNGSWHPESNSISYAGTMKNREINSDGTENITYVDSPGTLRFVDQNTFYWTNPESNNYDRGPFVKQ